MSNNSKEKTESFVNARAFMISIVIIACLMIAAYAATLLIPCEGIPFWKWILSPILVLTSDDRITVIGIILFLVIVGGVFNTLNNSGVMRYMIDKIANSYADKKYKLMAMIMLFFMSMGSLIGSFEEVVAMAPIVVALSIKLGWDCLVGLSMSLLAIGCGFAAGVFNPFSVGVAQNIAGLPMFSGAWFRAINFVFIYALVFLFTRGYARKTDKSNKASFADN